MSRACTVCQHPRKAEIDKALVANAPIRSISGNFDLSIGSLKRHRANHIAALVAKAEQEGAAKLSTQLRAEREKQLDYSIDVAKDLYILHSIHRSKLQEAREAGDVGGMSLWSNHVRKNLRLAAEVQRLLPSPTFNLLVNPQFTQIVALLREELGDDPARLRRIARRIYDMEGEGEGAPEDDR